MRNQVQHELVEEQRKAANQVCSAVMALIATRHAQAEDGSRRNKGRSKPWQARLSAHELNNDETCLATTKICT